MNSKSNTLATPAAPASAFLLLLTLAIGFVMAMIDVTAVNVALSDIALSLKVPLSGLVWVVDGYTLTFAALLLAGGALADRYGPKTVYQGGLALFLLGSLLCGAAPGGNALIAARLLQGAGAALFMPSSLSLLTHSFDDPATRAKMLAVWSALVGVAATTGPLIGGLLVHQFGWRSVFWVNLPIGLLGIAMAQTLIPATAPHRRPLSLLSHLLGFVALAALSFALIEGPARGWGSAAVLAAFAVLVLTAGLLLRRERGGAHPLLAPELLANASFGAANGIGFLINFAMFGQLFLLSLYLQQSRGADALQSGLQLLPTMAGFIIGNLLSSGAMARVGARRSMMFNLGAAAALGLWMTRFQPEMAYWLLALCVFGMNLLVGVAIPAMTTTVMQVAGKVHANSAAAALNANRQIGALVGVALIGAVLHAMPLWQERLMIGFAIIALAYAGAAALVYRYIRMPSSGV